MRYIYILFPIAPLLVSLVYTLSSLLRRNNTNIVFILLALSLGLINYTRTPTSDLAEYYSIFEMLKDKEYSEFILFVHIDFVFYFISMLLVKIFDNIHITILFWTFIAYFIYFKSLELVNNSFLNQNKQVLILVVLFSISLGLLFNHSSHLVRQFVSTSLLIYSVLLVTLQQNHKKANIIFLIAGLIHFSIFVFAPLYFIKKLQKRIVVLLIPILFLISFLLGFENILLTLSNTVSSTSYAYFGELIVRINMYINENNGNIRLGAFIKTGGLLLFSWILLLKSNKYNFLTYAFIYLCILLVLFRNTDLVLIRYFFYMHLYICVFYSYCLETPI